jgi:hypothetical protein
MGSLSALLWALTVGAVPVDGETPCPTAEEVGQALVPLSAGTRPSDHRVHLDHDAGQVTVTLIGATGATLARRSFEAGPGCPELAQAVAIVIVTWEAELPAVTSHLAPAPGAPASSPWQWELAAGAGISSVGDVAPAALVSVALGPPGRWVGVLSFAGAGGRSATLTPGNVSWQRWELGLGARARLTSAPDVSLEMDALGAVLSLAGSGFTEDGSAVQLEPGARLAVRAAWHWSPWLVWVGVSGAAWPVAQVAEVAGVSGSARIPRVEAWALLGGAYAVP